jgi:L-iditol 2-dehydrogenase
MKAAVYLGGAKNIQVQTVPDPVLREGEALLRIGACNVCGVDMRTWTHGDAKIAPPRILGHELAGTVEELGGQAARETAGVAVGDRVVMYPVLACGACAYCRRGRANLCDTRTTMSYQHDGAFAELMVVPRAAVGNGQLIRIPDHVSFEEAALGEPLGCTLHAHSRLGIGIKDSVVVIGAGPIGLLHALVSRIEGATHVCLMDVSVDRLELARRFGLDSYVQVTEDGAHIKAAQALSDGLGPEVVIVACAASQAQADALEMAAKGARIEFFGGLPKSNPFAHLNTNLIHYRELEVTGSFSENIDDFKAALRLVNSGKFPAGEIVTHRFPLEEMLSALELIQAGKTIKVSIQPNRPDRSR